MTTLLLVRALFGIAMGGEWGIGSALTMETIPASSRGAVSGLLQTGYPSGYFLASLAVYLFYDRLGWRWMFVLGVVAGGPGVLHPSRHRRVASVARAERAAAPPRRRSPSCERDVKLALYAMVLMTAFNFFSHGSQDAYPTFLKVQHHFDTRLTSLLTAIANIGAICGGLLFGSLSERIGRRRAIIIAALIALPALPFWAYRLDAADPGLGAFLMQLAVQGAWGVVPVHLNELSPPGDPRHFSRFRLSAR